MKKIIILALALCLFLCSCSAGGKGAGNFVPEVNLDSGNGSPSFFVSLPGEGKYKEVYLESRPDTVESVFEDSKGNGFIVVLKTRSAYSAEDMVIETAISAEGKICDIYLREYHDSKDMGEDYVLSYVGEDSALGGVDIVAGTTQSSETFKSAVEDAFDVLAANGLIQL